jgi:hypothetical protein
MPMGIKEFDVLIRQQFKPINCSNKLLTHLAPLWEMGVSKWNNLLTVKNTSPTTLIYHMQPTDAIIEIIPRGIRTSPKIQIRTEIDTLMSTLLLTAGTEHLKISKDLTQKITLIHPS